jgi:hypothetical protein
MSDRPAQTTFPSSLSDLIMRAGKTAPVRAVEGWNPAHCGEIDMRIGADGNWYYRDSLIAREALVRLFASILRREPDGRHVLVTPVEKLAIQVDDAPFLAVEMTGEGSGANQALTFRTNMGDLVRLDREHPLRFDVEGGHGGLKPYILVRGGLEALLTRALMYDLVALAEDAPGAKGGEPGLWSGGVFFALPIADPAFGSQAGH